LIGGEWLAEFVKGVWTDFLDWPSGVGAASHEWKGGAATRCGGQTIITEREETIFWEKEEGTSFPKLEARA
jgi:hypothetical protein